MAQFYKITNIKNLKDYIGVVIASGKTYLDRFVEHMEGKGGVWIWRDIQTGEFTKDDFVVELLLETSQDCDINGIEEELIRSYNTLYPNGYNGNCGNHIVITEESKQKSQRTYQKNRALGRHRSAGRPGMAIYRYPDGTIAKLPITHHDVVSGLVKHINYDPESICHKSQLEKDKQREKNGGYTDKQVVFTNKIKIISKNYPHMESWQQGREKFKKRMSNKDFTEKEKELYFKKRSGIVKNQWAKLSENEKEMRTDPGLQIMNSKFVCEHCMVETNSGNYHRWHGTNCKKASKC